MHLVAEETAGDVDLLAPDDDNLLAVQNLLRHDRRKPSEEMALAINNDGGRGEGGHMESEGRVKRVKIKPYKSSQRDKPVKSKVNNSYTTCTAQNDEYSCSYLTLRDLAVGIGWRSGR